MIDNGWTELSEKYLALTEEHEKLQADYNARILGAVKDAAELAADIACVIINKHASGMPGKYAAQEMLEETIRILEGRI